MLFEYPPAMWFWRPEKVVSDHERPKFSHCVFILLMYFLMASCQQETIDMNSKTVLISAGLSIHTTRCFQFSALLSGEIYRSGLMLSETIF